MHWQPIETAPRDGSDVLCCWAGRDGWEILRWKRSAPDGQGEFFGVTAENYADDLDLQTNQPTHWLLVPRPPGVVESVQLGCHEHAPASAFEGWKRVLVRVWEDCSRPKAAPLTDHDS